MEGDRGGPESVLMMLWFTGATSQASGLRTTETGLLLVAGPAEQLTLVIRHYLHLS